MAEIEWRSVYSTMILRVGFDFTDEAMMIHYAKNDRIAMYMDVPYKLFDQCSKAYSVGDFVNEQIKGKFEWKYLT